MNEITDWDIIADRIEHVLTLYPNISPAMLQVGIGNRIASKNWRPVLLEMIEKGEVNRQETYKDSPTGRSQRYEWLWLDKVEVREAILAA